MTSESRALGVLVSTETDDQAGHKLLSQIKGVYVLPYDPNEPQLSAEQRQAAVLIPPYRSSHRPIPLLDQLPGLRLVQLLTAGVDEWDSVVPKHVLLSNARGAVAGPVSEWALSAILALYRQWPALTRYQDAGIWAHRRVDADTLQDKNVLVIGAGPIGAAIADRVQALGARATLVGRTARDRIHAANEVPNLLTDHQVVVLAMPLTNETEGLVDKDFLAAMPDGALLVNAARGRIVRTDALVAELQTGRIRAALDVTDPEPLPGDHPQWTCQGVIISPHMARTVPGTPALCHGVAAGQIAQLVGGATPSNVVTARRNTAQTVTGGKIFSS